jgi:hypothetical protein
MCTVTYIPTENDGFLVAHNRDERIDRRMATPPLSRVIRGRQVIYPVDPEGMGTWIGISDEGKLASLLNGGTKSHKRKPPYKHSRGLVIPAYFSFSDVEEFHHQYDFSGLEPFTLVVLENSRMFMLVWEDETLTLSEKNRRLPHIFFSHSLYPKPSLENRSVDFYRWYVSNRIVKENDLLNYNLQQRFELDQIIKFDTGKHILKTVNVSLIRSDEKLTRFHFFDSINDVYLSTSIPVKKNQLPIPAESTR